MGEQSWNPALQAKEERTIIGARIFDRHRMELKKCTAPPSL